MRISGNDPIRNDPVVHGSNQVAKDLQAQQERSARIAGTEPDKVEFSARARDIQRIKEVLAQTPEVRQDRIEAARKALESGTLNLQGKDLAERIILDTLQNTI
ncbi:MAG: flagellar biosynthesis anti-sigma factor FlgM [Nitrospinota bacterium]|nr:MAG: flagellar biosynthesis anti-sigma factor FlgM [Nitrospinota bacterium]